MDLYALGAVGEFGPLFEDLIGSAPDASGQRNFSISLLTLKGALGMGVADIQMHNTRIDGRGNVIHENDSRTSLIYPPAYLDVGFKWVTLKLFGVLKLHLGSHLLTASQSTVLRGSLEEYFNMTHVLTTTVEGEVNY